jgi:hypothetical protein
MGHSDDVLSQVSQLTGCEIMYHPMKIQQLHIKFKPDDDSNEVIGSKKNIDRWHCDTTSFVLIVFATDPDEYTGGEVAVLLEHSRRSCNIVQFRCCPACGPRAQRGSTEEGVQCVDAGLAGVSPGDPDAYRQRAHLVGVQLPAPQCACIGGLHSF